jgi:hypothetical protein
MLFVSGEPRVRLEFLNVLRVVALVQIHPGQSKMADRKLRVLGDQLPVQSFAFFVLMIFDVSLRDREGNFR